MLEFMSVAFSHSSAENSFLADVKSAIDGIFQT